MLDDYDFTNARRNPYARSAAASQKQASMPESFRETYRGHDLDFTPRASAGGGFVARLQVIHSFGAHRDQFSVDVSSMVFAEAEQAALHARQAGLKWVDDRVDARP